MMIRELAEVKSRELAAHIRSQLPDDMAFILILATTGGAGYCCYASDMSRESATAIMDEIKENMEDEH